MKCEIKYAPKNLDEVIFPSTAVQRRITGYATGQLSGHIMLHGPNGTGKTTVANLLVNELGNGHPHVDRCDADELLAKPNVNGGVDIVGALPDANDALLNALIQRMAKAQVAKTQADAELGKQLGKERRDLLESNEEPQPKVVNG